MAELDAAFAVAWMNAAAAALDEACGHLTELDAARGDADHGVNMQRGFAAIAATLKEAPPESAEAAFLAASKTLRKTVGGTSGPLWAVALRRVGKSLGADESLGAAIASAAAGVSEIGGAAEGDNTMLDALLPAARALEEPHDSLRAGVIAAAEAAEAGAAATADRAATKGRASYHGERGIGTPDPGATSAAIVIRALTEAVDS